MPNGRDRMFNRLVVCIGSYRARFGKWPVEARLAPDVLQNIENVLGPEQFRQLGERIRISSTSDVDELEVCGDGGAICYEAVDLEDDAANSDFERAHDWLEADPK